MTRLALAALLALPPVASAQYLNPGANLPQQTQGTRGDGVPAVWVRPGFHVAAVTEPIDREARFLEFDDQGRLFVSRPGPGDVLCMADADNNGTFEKQTTFVKGYDSAHGLHFVDGWLWFTQSGAIHKARDADGDGVAEDVQTVVPEGQLPKGGGHWWRSICVAGGVLYTSIGDNGNINVADERKGEEEREKIWRFNVDGTGKTLFATGLRNTEKLRLRPGTSELWGADHGSDWFGREFGETGRPRSPQPITDLYPPEEFNHYVEGGFYGHPFVVGDGIPRLEFLNDDDKKRDLVELAGRTTPPAYQGGAHWANNGFAFTTKDSLFGKAGDALIAYHGSWNSSRPVGYQVHRVVFDEVTGRPMGGLTVVSGLGGRDGREVIVRPVDVAEAPDGSAVFSCSKTRRVYRITKAG